MAPKAFKRSHGMNGKIPINTAFLKLFMNIPSLSHPKRYIMPISVREAITREHTELSLSAISPPIYVAIGNEMRYPPSGP